MKENRIIKGRYYDFRLICVAYRPGTPFAKHEVEAIKKKARGKLTDGAMCVQRTPNALFLFDAYRVDKLNFRQRLRYNLRKIFAAASGNVGVNPILIIIQ